MTSIIGVVCRELERTWKNVRLFAFNNRTVFEIFFILLYSLLQLLLIIFVDVYSQRISFIISVFAILVLSVFALHKLLMESRIKMLENKVTELEFEKQRIRLQMKELFEKYIVAHDAISRTKTKDLNKVKEKKQ